MTQWILFMLKHQQGVEFGEYSHMQYRYAKDYYKIVQEELTKLDAAEGKGTKQ